MPWPIQTRSIAEVGICPNIIDAAFVNSNESKVCRYLCCKPIRVPDPHVIRHPFEALKKIDTKKPDRPNNQDDGAGDQRRDALDRAKLHWSNKTKKPGQYK